MGSLFIVISSPGRCEFYRITQITGPVFIQTLIPKLAIEAFNVSVLGRLARLNQQGCDVAFIGVGPDNLCRLILL